MDRVRRNAARRASCMSVSLLFAMAAAAWVEEPIEEVVVTAAKREQGVYQVPASLSVFDGGQLAQRGIADLVDVGKFVPNLNVTTFSAGHTSSANPFIRGIGTQDHLITTDPGVGVYVDGVYLGRQVGQHWNLSNVERVEVLRGPQGTLYGRNSIGGAINIVTTVPGERPGMRASARVGSRERLDVSLHGDGNLGGELAATVSAGVNRRAGLGEFVNLPSAGAGVGETRELFGRAVLAWRPSSAFAVTVAADANDGENGLNPYTTHIDELPGGAVYAAGYRNSDVASDPYDNNTGQADQVRVTNEARGVSVTVDWAFTEGLGAKMIGSVRRSAYEAGLDDDGFRDDFLSFPENGEADQTSIELQLSGAVGAADVVAGVYSFTEEGANVQDPTVFLGSRGRFELSQELDSAAVFANASVDLGRRWRLAGGVRRSRDRKRASTDVGTGRVSAERTWRQTSWDLSAHRTVGDRMAAYAAVQSGYQSGQFPARPYCLFADPDCFAAGDNITAVNYEIGLKGQPTGRLELSAAVFHTRYEDLPYQVSTTAGPGFSTVNLIVEQRTTGVELEGTFHATERLRLSGTLGWLEVDVERQRGVRPVAPLTPELTFSISPEYRWPLAGGGEVAARADYSFRDAMWGEPSSDPGRLTRIGSRGLVNFHLGYTPPDGTWTVAVYGRNAGDERYDNARLNTGDYLLRILSNDAGEFGMRAERRF
ncbi:MAG: TonB-dependent receptor [Gammaproteobacteria bacterium]|nr:TonB-dependent receptor [Gammaproteobacteria bacterium]MYI74928.1 TonB-dependent receptor [Acidobacteriota bacterium]